MSAAEARDERARSASPEAEERPQLFVVRGAAPMRSAVPFILTIVAVLVAALAATLLLNARMAQTAYEMKTAQVQLNTVNDHITSLQTSVEKASSATELAKKAAALGMVPAGTPGTVNLKTGTVSGGTAAESAASSKG